MMRAVLILGLAFVLIGCGGGSDGSQLGQSTSDHTLDETTFDAPALAMVQKKTGIALPNGSCGLNIFYQGLTLDPSFVAKIWIPKSSGDELASRIKKLRNESGTVDGLLTKKVA